MAWRCAGAALAGAIVGAAAGCEGKLASTWQPEPPGARPAGAGTAIWPTPQPTSAFGRGAAPQRAERVALAGEGADRTTRVVPVAGDGEPLAVLAGADAVTLVAFDGAIRWTHACKGEVRLADRGGVVCSGADGTTGVTLDGNAWTDPRPLAVADARGVLVVGEGRTVVPLDRATGAAGKAIEVVSPGARPADVRARCGQGDELYAVTAGMLRRFASMPYVVRQPQPGRPRTPQLPPAAVAKVRWATKVGEVVAVDAGGGDACAGVVVVTVAVTDPGSGTGTSTSAETAPPKKITPTKRRRPRGRSRRRRPPPPPSTIATVDGEIPPRTTLDPPRPPAISTFDRAATIAVLAIDRATGRIVGGPVRVRGVWPARDGSTDLELATAAGIEQRPRDLSAVRVLPASPVVGALLDRRGDRRLVAGPDGSSLVILDGAGVRAIVAAPAGSAALGEDHVLALAGGAPIRFAIPDGRPDPRAPQPTAPPQPPVQRRELPPLRAPDPAGAITPATPIDGAVTAPQLDPEDTAMIWLAAGTTVARLDLRARTWTAHANACPPGAPIGVAIALSTIACAARDDARSTLAIQAIARDGAPAWSLADVPARGDVAIAAAGDTLVVTTGDRALVLDAATGAIIDDRRTATGLPAAVVPVQVDTADAFVAVEHDLVVARPSHAPLVPLWAARGRGAVTDLLAGGGDLVVVLDHVDPYRLDPLDGGARSLAAGAERWTLAGDLVIGATAHDDGWAIRAFTRDGEQFRTAAIGGHPFAVAPRARDRAAAVIVVHGTAAAVLDPTTGQPVDHLALPERTTGAFATIVDGRPVAGAIVAGPLGALTF